MDFEEKVRSGAYECILPYGTKGSAERQAFKKREQELDTAFHTDLRTWLLANGVPDRYVNKTASFVWQEGHSSGYTGVLDFAFNLLEIFA